MSLQFWVLSQNLLPNPGFELENTCQKYQELCAPKGWRSSTLKNFYYPEYIPNIPKSVRPFEGRRTIALTVFYEGKDYERKFAQASLICPLKKDARYRFKIHYLLKKVAIEEFGVYFTDSLKVFKDNDFFKEVQPQILIPVQNDAIEGQWIAYETEFVASGNEKGIILGNFAEDSLTNIIPTKNINKRNFEEESNKRIYIRFDEISLIPLDSTIYKDCDWQQNLAIIYSDSIRHILEHPKSIHPLDISTEKKPQNHTFSYAPAGDTYIIGADTVSVNEIFSFEDINFETNSARLLESSIFTLGQIVIALKNYPELNLRIVGHTDDTGAGNFNKMLSEQRARAVADYLVSRGINRRRLITFGMGAGMPVSENDTITGRLKNRRVDFFLYTN